MSKLSFSSFFIRQDSLSQILTNPDTNQANQLKENIITSSSSQKNSNTTSLIFLSSDSSINSKKINRSLLIKETTKNNIQKQDSFKTVEIITDSLKQIKLKEPQNLFSFNNSYDSFDYKHEKVFIEHIDKSNTEEKNVQFFAHHLQSSQLNWTLFIGLISITLILSIKTYYRKFLNQVIFTLINFQLADKMFHEKNILLRRAFFLLNINFALIFSLFLLLISVTFNIELLKSRFLNYLMILAIFISLLIIRYLIFYTSGLLFNKQRLISEYLHNKYLINKNIGILLFPVVFTSIFSSAGISKILLICACAFIVIASFVKILRGFQIIVRNGVLLFYTILYLCTLELLPLVLGSKIIISLR